VTYYEPVKECLFFFGSMEPLVGVHRPAIPAACLGGIAFAAAALTTYTVAHHSAHWTAGATSSRPVAVTARPSAAVPLAPWVPSSEGVPTSAMQLPREGGERISTGWAGSLVGAFGVSLVVLVGLVARMQRGVAAIRTYPPKVAMFSYGGVPEMKVAQYDDPGFQAVTIANFPEKAIATPDEARVLWAKAGYDILDVRSDWERSDRGPIKAEKGTVNIPLFNARYEYEPSANKKVVKQQANPKFLEQVRARFPSKDAQIVVMCSDGRRRSMQALELLEGEGYMNLVGMKGGFNYWDEVFDRYLRRRDVGIATEVYNHVDSEGSPVAGCGIHASGAQFEMMDSLKYDKQSLKDSVEWQEWTEAVQSQRQPASYFAYTGVKQSSPKNTIASQQPLAMFSYSGIPEMKVAQYDDPGFQAVTFANFPEKAIATPDEARVLWAKGAYDILDVRSDWERSDRGPIKAEKGTVNIPLFNARYEYEPSANKKVVKQQANPRFLDQVRARFPSKDAPIVVMCSDGRRRSMQALELLEGEGYMNLVGMKGGFNYWDEVFDRYLRRRDVGIATEVYNHVDSEGSPVAGCGIHASGAQFEMMDSLKYDKQSLKDPVEWKEWTEAVLSQQVAMFTTTGVAAPRYDSEAFEAATLASFPEKTMATYEEARVLLLKGGGMSS